MTSITQVQGGLLIALAQTLKRFGKGRDLKGNAFDLAFSSSGIGRMRTATLPGAESGMRSHHCEVYQAVLVRNKPHNIPINGGNMAEDRCNLAAVPIAPERVRCVRVADPIQPMLSVREATSAGVRLIAAAATLFSRCDTDPVPGIGRIEGDRASSQASTICRGEAP